MTTCTRGNGPQKYEITLLSEITLHPICRPRPTACCVQFPSDMPICKTFVDMIEAGLAEPGDQAVDEYVSEYSDLNSDTKTSNEEILKEGIRHASIYRFIDYRNTMMNIMIYITKASRNRTLPRKTSSKKVLDMH